MKYYDEDTVYELMSAAEECATAYEFGVHKSVDIKDYPSIELGWHTGTPTEDGYYLCHIQFDSEDYESDEEGWDIPYWFTNGSWEENERAEKKVPCSI